ncbi:MAG: SHD1 domain-containing protein [Mariniblastus sp.]
MGRFRSGKLMSLCCVNGLIFLIALVGRSSNANAIQDRILFEAGDKIEVQWQRDWFEAEVTEILPGGRALKAKFTDERGKKRTWMFPSSRIRETESGAAVPFGNRSGFGDEKDEPANEPKKESKPTSKIRKWTSADGNFSVDAKFVDFDGEKVELIKLDQRTIKVPLATFGEDDVAHVKKLMADRKAKAENPFKVESPEDANNPFRVESPKESDDPFAVAPKKRPESSVVTPVDPASSKTADSEPDPFNVKRDPRAPRMSSPPFHKPKPKSDSAFNELPTFGGESTSGSKSTSGGELASGRNASSNSNSAFESKPQSTASNPRTGSENSSTESSRERGSSANPPVAKARSKVSKTGDGMSNFIRWGIFLTSLLFGSISVVWGWMNRGKYK